MRPQCLSPLVALTFALVLGAAPAEAGVLEVPSQNSELSGVLFASGWKCPPVGKITFVFDDFDPLPAATGLSRDDTRSACGNGGRNGFLAQFNYGLLGDGPHTVRVLDDGVEFDRADFTVTTFGTRFLRGANGTYELPDFPEAGATTLVEWKQGQQGFVVVDYEPAPVGPTPTPVACPTNGPIRDLRNDCSHLAYGYQRNGVVAAMSSNGNVVAICVTDGGPDVICQGGPVSSRTAFLLTGANVNGGPLVPLGAGSQGSISSNGQTLSFTIVVSGEVFAFNGFAFFGVESLAASAASAESALAGRDASANAASAQAGGDASAGAALESRVAEALVAIEALLDEAASVPASAGDAWHVRDALGRLRGEAHGAYAR